ASTAQRRAISRLLFDDLGFTRARIEYRAIEPANDDPDPLRFDWSRFDFGDPVTRGGTDFVALSRPFGLATWFGVMNVELAPAWLHAPGGPALAPGMEAELGEYVAAMAKRYADLGAPAPFMSVANEPSYAGGRGMVITPAQM